MSAEYISKLLGVATAQNKSFRKEAGIDGELDYGMVNISTIERNLFNSDEILRLLYNKMIGILRGNKPVLIDKVIYTKHPLANELKDLSINDYVPEWKLQKNEMQNQIKNNTQNKNKGFNVF